MRGRYDEDSLGCGGVVTAYLLGSYFVAGIATVYGDGHWSLLIAPVSLPCYFALGLLLIGNSEVPVQASELALWACFLLVAVIGFWGLLRSLNHLGPWHWPLALLAIDALFAFVCMSSG